jgi:hypothetical protein
LVKLNYFFDKLKGNKRLLLHHEVGETKHAILILIAKCQTSNIPKFNNGDNNATTNNKEDIAAIRDRPW